MTKVYGIVGHPITHSLSPAMHNAAIGHYKIDAEYKRFDIDPGDPENLANFCYETDLNNIGGFSVTMPYKEEVMGYMDHYDHACKAIGAANTVVNENNKLIGYNTDVLGAIQALRERSDLAARKVLVLGAGGAARAVCYGLKEYGCDVFVFSRTSEKADELATAFELNTIDYNQIPREGFEVVVNATPVGTAPNTQDSLLHASDLKEGMVVMDMITDPTETQLIKEAKKAGAETVTGERMLLYQAAEQFKLWFGLEAPLEIMENALYKGLQNRLS